jgi:hypothetical protein
LTLPLFSPPAARNPNADGAKPCAFDFTILSKGLRKIRQQQKQPPKEFPSATSDSIFAKERAGAEADDPDAAVMLYKTYTYEALGKELQELRPPGAGKDGKDWFSLQELQGRIAKLAAKDKDTRLGGQFDALKQSMRNIEKTDKQKAIRNSNLIWPSTDSFPFFPYNSQLSLYCLVLDREQWVECFRLQTLLGTRYRST